MSAFIIIIITEQSAGGILKSFIHSIIFKRTGFILGCENWDRYDFKVFI